jgi:UDP-N-acetylglucosamine:LPS N-acetylglucosamine transferase
MKKILVLSASYGDGHNAAARSVRDAIRVRDPLARAEVVDLFEIVHPSLNALMKRGYQGLVRHAPGVWSNVYRFFDKPALFRPQIGSLKKLRNGLAALLAKEKPHAVVSTYPVYAHLITQLFPEPSKRSFRVYTVITDSISVCAAWYLTQSDCFIVANEETAEVLRQEGVEPKTISTLGFPVSPVFAQGAAMEKDARRVSARPKLLYVINTGKARTGRMLDGLLEPGHMELTITTGRDEALRARLNRHLREYGHRVRILGWTDQMPQLLMNHDLLIAKAGGAMVQEAIAARCPMIINQVIPGQEEGNARLIESLEAGAVASKRSRLADLVQEAFANNGRVWQQWRDNLKRVSRPDSALRIADLVLGKNSTMAPALEAGSSSGRAVRGGVDPDVEPVELLRSAEDVVGGRLQGAVPFQSRA